ncbi:MAG: DUF2828 family protein, partial [Solobacterium sp.]|nr:DUF2828 family protein [Solobacterium sp.]
MTESVFLKALETESAKKLTENGAAAMKTAGAGALLDLFAMCGAMRMRKQDVMAKYAAALNEDRLLAARLAFYTRDVRGGLGERETARVMFAALAAYCPQVMRKNLALIPEYGRWDDLFILLKVPSLKDNVIALLQKQLETDLQGAAAGRPVSLLAKWMPSVNTSSYETRKLARKLAAAFGMSERDYRHMLAGLRAYLNVTEVRLSDREYGEIRYPAVPSGAMLKYRNAFVRHDHDRFVSYLQDVENGKAAIHAGTQFPYDIAGIYTREVFGWSRPETVSIDRTAEAQWQALPD